MGFMAVFVSRFVLQERDVRDKPLLVGDYLYIGWGTTGIHNEAVDGDIPGHRIVVHTAGDRPVRIHQMNVKNALDFCGFVTDGTFGNAKTFGDER